MYFEYPAPLSKSNLITIKDISERFGVISGLSDHTLGNISPILSVSYGAKIIEKHFILNKSIGGPDFHFHWILMNFQKWLNP